MIEDLMVCLVQMDSWVFTEDVVPISLTLSQCRDHSRPEVRSCCFCSHKGLKYVPCRFLRFEASIWMYHFLLLGHKQLTRCEGQGLEKKFSPLQAQLKWVDHMAVVSRPIDLTQCWDV